MRQIFFYPALLVIVLLVSGSCDLPEGPDFGKGTISLNLPKTRGQEAAAYNAAAPSLSVLSDSFTGTLVYRLTLTGPGETQTLNTGGGGITLTLDAGEWTVAAVAYDPVDSTFTTPVGTGGAVVTVTAGQSSSVRIPMSVHPLYEGSLSVFYIHNEAELRRIGSGLPISPGITYYLERDIVLTGPWTPIGDSTTPFEANFDGQGHSITINSFDTSANPQYVGFFGYVKGAGVPGDPVIKDMTIRYDGSVNMAFSGTSYIGLVAGYAEHTSFQNIKVLANLSIDTTTRPNAGGIAGYISNNTEITNCHVSGGIIGDFANTAYDVGGIVGFAHLSSITKASFTGNLDVTNTAGSGGAGGIIGFGNGGQISSCYASAKIEARGAPAASVYAGGIAGQINSTGSGEGVIKACYAWVLVTAGGGSANYNHAGGIAGSMDNPVTNYPSISGSYARGTVKAVNDAVTSAYAGGIAEGNVGNIAGCIALNDRIESSASSDVHGIAGHGSGTYSNNYAASGITFVRSAFTPNVGLDGITTKAYADFRGSANVGNYPSAYWNFAVNGDWRWINGYDYPVLAWQTTAPRDPATL